MSSVCDVIGIDLGTTNSCVGIFDGTKVEIIPTLTGARTFPSIVCYGCDETDDISVGEGAKMMLSKVPSNTIQCAKRLIGRSFDDPEIQNDIKNSPVKITRSSNGKCQYHVQYKGKEKIVTPEEVSALILSEAKKYADQYLGKEVKKAVVTVPAYFKDSQRTSTSDAGVIAGLNVIRMINEPTSASIAYGLEKKEERLKDKDEVCVLVFDLGGGTFDLSVINIDEGIYEVVSTCGDSHLGGEDFDQRLLQHMVSEFKRMNKKDISVPSQSNPEYNSVMRARRRLQTACETAKKNLSSCAEASISIDCLYDGCDFNCKITRSRFEELCSDLFRKCINQIDDVLRDAKKSKGDIDEIVLVGGSSRILKIQKMLKDYFNDKDPCSSINPDECVAYGAAIQGGILSGVSRINDKELLLMDVTPLSLGVETNGAVMEVLIKRNTQIPTSVTKSFTTAVNNQPAVTICIYEGERQLTKDNHLMGKFDLQISPAPKGVPKIDITISLDANGIIVVSATETSSGKTEKINIKNDSGRLSEEHIKRCVEESEKFKEIDTLNRQKIDMKNTMESLLNEIKDNNKDNSEVSDLLQKINSLTLNDSIDAYKELEASVQKLCQQSASSSQGQGQGQEPPTNSSSNKGPVIEEVD